MNNDEINVQSYFTKDIHDRISSVTDEERNRLFLDLEGTDLWFAILKYSQDRTLFIQNALLSLDPIKDPTSIARAQGSVSGMTDLWEAVVMLVLEAQKKEGQLNSDEGTNIE